MIKAVIFDMDGLLIDTEKYHLKCWRDAAGAMGYEMSRETGLGLRSLAGEYAEPFLKEQYGQDFDFQKLRQIKRKLYQNMLKKYPLETKKGAEELLEWLGKKGYKRAVATATALDTAEENLQKAGIRKYFDYVISAHYVAHGKPMPDVYLEACKKIGEEPKDCLALEDSANGAWAAVRAGCQTIVVPDLAVSPGDLKEKLLAEKESLLEVKEYMKKSLTQEAFSL